MLCIVLTFLAAAPDVDPKGRQEQRLAANVITPGAAKGPTSATPASKPAEEEEKVFTPALEQKLETGLRQEYVKEHYIAAVNLYTVIADAPESELKRDVAEFNFAQALAAIGLSQAAIEYYIDIIEGRRSPEMLGRALGALDELSRQHLLDEDRLIDEVLFGSQYGDLPAETSEFVEYFQALGELRRGLQQWGTARLETLSKKDTPYGWRAKSEYG